MSESSRSRSYPAIDLPEAVEVLEKIVSSLGWGEYDRDAMAQALDYTSGTSGAAIRKIAALTSFGILRNSRQGFYSPTPLARALHDSKDAVEIESSLRKAFLSPPLFREIVETCLPAGRVPRLLAHALRSHGIASNAMDEVARVFMASGQFAKVLAADGVFEESYLRSIGQGPLPKPQALPPGETQAQAARAEDQQVFKIYLTDGKTGEIRLPQRLNDHDIRILKKQIEVLEIQVEANKPAPPLSFPRRQERGGSS